MKEKERQRRWEHTERGGKEGIDRTVYGRRRRGRKEREKCKNG